AALIKAFARHGAQCVVNYVQDAQGRNRTDAAAVAAATPGSMVIQCDVGDSGQVASMMSQIQSKHGGLDIVVNNGGVLKDRTIKKMSGPEWEDVLRINLTG